MMRFDGAKRVEGDADGDNDVEGDADGDNDVEGDADGDNDVDGVNDGVHPTVFDADGDADDEGDGAATEHGVVPAGHIVVLQSGQKPLVKTTRCTLVAGGHQQANTHPEKYG
jgi:hypothetical protein